MQDTPSPSRITNHAHFLFSSLFDPYPHWLRYPIAVFFLSTPLSKISSHHMPTIHVSSSTFPLCMPLIILSLQALPSTMAIDANMTGNAGRPPVYRLPPEILAHVFGFLPELVTGPIAMTRIALDVTHVSSWFRAVGIELQSRLWSRLPLHSADLTILFSKRIGRTTVDILWSQYLDWEDPWLEDIFFTLLDPPYTENIRVLEIEAPHWHEKDSWDPYRRVVGRLFMRLLPGPHLAPWTSLERLSIAGLEDDISDGNEDGWEYEMKPSFLNSCPDEYAHVLHYLHEYDLPGPLHVALPRLANLEFRNLYPPTLHVIDAVADCGTQMRSLTLTHLRRVKLHHLADYLSFMPNLEHLELRGLSNRKPTRSWATPVHLPALRCLIIQARAKRVVAAVIRCFYMEHADVTLVFPFCARWVADMEEVVEDVEFYWKAGQTSQHFSHEPIERRSLGPVPDEEREELKQRLLDMARGLGACMRKEGTLEGTQWDGDEMSYSDDGDSSSLMDTE